MELVKLSPKGQVVIPAVLRRRLKIDPGTYFKVEEAGHQIVLTPLEKRPIDRLYGRFSDDSILPELECEHAEEIAADGRS